MPAPVHSFGPFHFDTRKLVLSKDGEIVALGRRGARLLAHLLAAGGEVVTKDELIEAGWPDEIVEESNLSVQIAKLRRAIGAEWIRTVERVGYQFLRYRANAAPTLSRRQADSFPVLALALTAHAGDPVLDGIGRALQADLIVALARFRSLHVASLDAGDRNADYRLAISLHARADHTPRAVLTLSETLSARICWAQSFTIGSEPAADAMAAGIESAVQSSEYRNGPRPNAPGAEAYGHYLSGRRVLNSSLANDNATALTHFMAAVALEPENPTYLAAASEAMHHRLSVGWEKLRTDDKQVARNLAYRTLALAEDDAVAIGLVGNTLFTVDEEDEGLALSRRAVAMNPNSQLTLACALHAELWAGKLSEHDRLSRCATEIAPNDPGQRFALNGRATAARLQGDDEAALGWAQRALAVGAGYSAAHWTVVSSLVGLGRQHEAERHLQRYLKIAPGVSERSIEAGQHVADRSRLKPLLGRLRQAGLPAR